MDCQFPESQGGREKECGHKRRKGTKKGSILILILTWAEVQCLSECKRVAEIKRRQKNGTLGLFWSGRVKI